MTLDEPRSSKVQYGTLEDKFDFTAEGTVANYSFYKYNSGHIHHCLVDGLEVLQLVPIVTSISIPFISLVYSLPFLCLI